MHIHFDQDTKVLDFTEDRISLFHSGGASIEWNRPKALLSDTIQGLLSKGFTEEELLDQWQKKGGNPLELFYFLERLKKTFLSFTLYHRSRPLCTLRSQAGCGFQLANRSQLFSAIEEASSFQISRFALIRNQNGILICETPLAAALLELKHPLAIDLWMALAQPTNLEALKTAVPRLPLSILRNFLALLHGGSFLEKNDLALKTWDFHDLIFHTRSRRGRYGEVAATRFRFLEEMAPLPPLKEMPEETSWTPLFTPDLDAVQKTEPSFVEVVETRRSIREYGQRPISSLQLGEFLYRTARVKGEKAAQHYEATKRPYPGGGACYELEIYPLIHHCEGFQQGLYYYHPQKHAITCLSEWNASLEELVRAGTISMGKTETPQILLLIGCRFRRLSWKYQSMAYATILKDTGVLIQTMYLVANAMGLAPCAIGAGNSDLFAKVARTNYYEETTVGEFALGSRKEYSQY